MCHPSRLLAGISLGPFRNNQRETPDRNFPGRHANKIHNSNNAPPHLPSRAPSPSRGEGNSTQGVSEARGTQLISRITNLRDDVSGMRKNDARVLIFFTFLPPFTTIYLRGRVAEWQTRTAQDRMDESP